MKKLVALFIALLMAFALTACYDEKESLAGNTYVYDGGESGKFEIAFEEQTAKRKLCTPSGDVGRTEKYTYTYDANEKSGEMVKGKTAKEFTVDEKGNILMGNLIYVKQK